MTRHGFDGKDIGHILRDLKERLSGLYGDRLVSVILYGSYARGEAAGDSDIDVMVVLNGEVSPGMEIDRTLDAVTDLNLEHNTLISLYPVSEEALERVRSPLYLNVRAEGVRV